MIAPLAVAAAVLAGGSHEAARMCTPNLAWQDRYPVWRGSTIAFQREPVGCKTDLVTTMAADGRRLRTVGAGVSPALSSRGRLAWTNVFGRIVVDGRDVTGGEDPAWSPSGDRLAFLRGEALWVREMASGAELRLADVAVFAPFSEAHVTSPSWSPDGQEIAYVRPGLKISVAHADGSGVRRLTSGLDRQVAPAWSPDGQRIAFMSDRGDSFDIWMIHPDGSETARLTTGDADESLPAWSPNGGRIAFLRSTGAGYGKAALLVMGGEGGFERRIAVDAHGFSQPVWSPDGSQIAFSSGRECGRWGLYVVDPDSGGGPRRITNRCRFTGTAGDDVVRGSPFRDVLTGGRGRDILDAGAGDNTIFARDGRRDVVRGGPGQDTAYVDRGIDRVTGVEKLLR